MNGPVTCTRCGRRSVPRGGPFCPYCGAYAAPLRWVAQSPHRPVPPARRRPPYGGPPRYRGVPRWGFAPGPWVPGSDPGPPDAVARTAAVLRAAAPLLWASAAVALLAAGAEVWRYVLLLRSRTGALPSGVVAASDALVTAAGTVSLIAVVGSGVLVVLWSLRAVRAAADRARTLPSRSPGAVVLAWLLPGPNLLLPGSLLAEIEHAALDRPAGARPRPSRLLRVWWVLWAVGVAGAAVVALWGLRTGVQARADGVVLHALLDLWAAATAGTTAVLLVRLTRLLAPAQPRARELLLAVGP